MEVSNYFPCKDMGTGKENVVSGAAAGVLGES